MSLDNVIIVEDSWDDITKAKHAIIALKDENSEITDEMPIYICDLGNLVWKIKNWKSNFADIGCYYAVKCNPDLKMLKFMKSLGMNFDCASKSEIKLMLELGVHPTRIVYSNPYKSISNLKFACKSGVNLMVFDSVDELDKITEIYDDKSKDLKLLLRIHVNDEKSSTPQGIKYGAQRHEIDDLFEKARSLNVNLVGVAFHCTGCDDATLYDQTIQYAHDVFEKAKQYGFSMNVIDIGGGFTDVPEKGLLIEPVMQHVHKSIQNIFKDEDRIQKLKIFAEPGQYFATSAFSLLTTVIGKRKFLKNNNTEIFYILNDGVHCSFHKIVCGFKNWFDEPVVITDKKSDETYPSTLWGPTCDSGDKIMKLKNLPELNIGDMLLWKGVGGYTSSFERNFNGFHGIRTTHVISEKWKKVALELKWPNVIVD